MLSEKDQLARPLREPSMCGRPSQVICSPACKSYKVYGILRVEDAFGSVSFECTGKNARKYKQHEKQNAIET